MSPWVIVAIGIAVVLAIATGCSDSEPSPSSEPPATDQITETAASDTANPADSPPRTEAMPGVIGTPQSEALALLRSLDLGLTPTILRERTAAFPEDTVIGSSPEKGQQLTQGQEVTLVVAIPLSP